VPRRAHGPRRHDPRPAPAEEIATGGDIQEDGTMGDSTATSGGRGYAADLLGIQARNLQALAQAQRSLLEGLDGLAARQVEVVGTAGRGSLAFLSPIPFGGDLRPDVERRIDALKAALLDGTAGSNSLTETAARAGAEVACLLQQRTLAALDELKAALVGALAPGAGGLAAAEA
jgi:hypothetical protein